jgi:large subunit ribosomal protein L30
MKKKLKVTQLQSGIGRPEKQRKTLEGLGLGRPRKAVVVDNTPAFRGMIRKVIHLVAVEEHDG